MKIKLIVCLISIFLIAFAGSGCSQQDTSSGSNENNGSGVVDENMEESKVLVVYFSCTGNTESVAKFAAELLNADIHEIIPEIPYTEEDLDYNNSSTRATREQNDPDVRPAISGTVDHLEEYDTILLGYPIWWGKAPKIISTFLESYDFSGKTMVPFCTSNSSGVGSSATDLHPLSPESTQWMEGTRFSAGTSKEDIGQWLVDIGMMNP